jgi:hypothetical protein
MSQIETSKLVGYAVLDAEDGVASASKLVGYAVLDAEDGVASTSKLVGYAVLDVVRPEVYSSKLVAYAVMDAPLVVGTVLGSDLGEWLYADQLLRQWLRDGEPIEDAVDETYEITEDDLGAMISLRVTAKSVAGQTVAYSNELGPIE